MSREARFHDGSEERLGPAHSGGDAVDCTTVMAEVWTFLDGECGDKVYARVCQHLHACPSCLDNYALDARFKNLIATKCGGDIAPQRRRW